jgi:organic radical activating enzyme
MLTVNEIFHSIQGESTRAGDRCVFVRLTACDLRCSWCDTPYAFHEGRKMSVDDVLSAVEGYGCPLVEITGGEPLLQEGVYELMDRLLAVGHTVMLETGGHRPIDRVPAQVVKIVDVKCPGSGEADKNDWGNRRLRIRPRCRPATAAGVARGGDSVFARTRHTRSEDAFRMGHRGSAAGARAIAAAQVHLDARNARRMKCRQP